MNRFNTICFVAMLLLSTSSFSAETTDSLNKTSPNSVLLQIDNFLSFSSFPNSIIYFKHHFNIYQAMRLGISLGGVYDDVTRNQNSTIIQEEKSKLVQIGLNIDYLKYPLPNYILKLYYGPGLNVAGDYAKADENTSSGPQTQIWAEIKGIFGLEWIFYKCFALNFEYNLLGQARFSSNEDYIGTDRAADYVLTSAFLFGLTLYIR
jgi:hypothetical protein